MEFDQILAFTILSNFNSRNKIAEKNLVPMISIFLPQKILHHLSTTPNHEQSCLSDWLWDLWVALLQPQIVF